MKNIVRNLVLIAAILCPSFAMPSGENRQLVKYGLRSCSLFAACLGGAFAGCEMLDNGNEIATAPFLCMIGVWAALPIPLFFNIEKMVSEINDASSIQLQLDTEKKDEDCEGTPFYYDYAPVAPFTPRSMAKPFIARCCVPTAISLMSYPFFKDFTPLFSSAVFHAGLQSCLYKARAEDRKSKEAASQQLEVSRRQSIRNQNRAIYKQAKEVSHHRHSSIEEAYKKFLSGDANSDDLKELITFVADKRSCSFSCRVLNEETDEEENNSFDDEVLKDLRDKAYKQVKADLLSEDSLFFKNISLLDDEAQQRLCEVYYSWTVKYAYSDNRFRSSTYCGERLAMLYENPRNKFSREFPVNRKWVMLDLISNKKFSIILGICVLTKENVLCSETEADLLRACMKLYDNSLGCDEKELDALYKLYKIFLDTDDKRSIQKKLDEYLCVSRAKRVYA